MENLLINIGADTKEFLSGLVEVGEKTGDLGDKLQGIGLTAGAAFAGYTASIMGAVYAYREEEKVSQEVEAILRSTGGVAGVTAEAIDSLAGSLSKSTTFSKVQVERGEEILATFTRIGKDTFPLATQATLDLAQRMGGDTAGAAQILGRALQDPMAGIQKLTRSGVIFTAQQKAQIETMEMSGNIAGAQAIVLKTLEAKYGGMAQAAAGGTGQIAVLKNAMEEMAAKVGAEFAPYVEMAASKLIGLIHAAEEHEGLLKFIAATLSAGAAVSGGIVALVAGALAFKQITSAMEIAGLAMKALGLSTRALVGATGLGLILIVGYEIYAHWNSIWPAMQAVFKAFVDNVGKAAGGLGKILLGAFSLDISLIKEGIAQAADAFVAGFKTIKDSVKIPSFFAATEEKKAEAAKTGRDLASIQAAEAARQIMAEEDRIRAMKLAAQRATNEALILEYNHHTAAVIALKKKEAQLLTTLADEKFKGDKAAVRKALDETQSQYDTAYGRETIARAKFENTYLKNDKNFHTLSSTDQAAYISAHQAALVGMMENESAAKEAVITADLEREIKAHNTFLQEQIRFSTAYAAINQAMHTAEYEGSQKAFSQLTQLTQSGHETLKSIGKAASVVDIEMKGAQSAMDIYAGFSTLPPWIGIPLGIAGAAAAELFAQEKAAQVLGLSAGGLVTGGIPGIDSVPAMMTPGELAVPPKNYEQVIEGEMLRRGAAKQAQAGMDGAPEPVRVQVDINFVGSASRVLTAQINQDKALGRYRGSDS